jgi:murein L,D-transpeptidase YcbB/YkuD
MEMWATGDAAGTTRASRFTVLLRLLLAGTLTILLATPSVSAASDNSDVGEAIAAILAREDPIVLDGVTLKSAWLRALYEGRTASPLWRGRVDAVTKVLGEAGSEGLDAAAYHPTAIAYRQSDRSTEGRAILDLLVSDAVVAYARDVRYGKSRPRVTAEAAAEPADPVPLAAFVVDASDAGEALRALSPTHPQYRALRAVLADYRAMVAAGVDWPIVPDGPTLRPGMTDNTVVPILRARLAASGEFTGDVHQKSRKLDPGLVEAVKKFQETHGLTQDGVVGPRVRGALNVGPATRVEQIVVNMERWRWLPVDLGERRVMVNIAAARMRLVDHDATVYEAPVIVGETDKMTPTFSSTITHVIFNPSWTVPDKIARKELLPKVQKDRAYFARQGIRLIGSWHPPTAGDDPASKDWGGAGGASGFRLRQAPGPQNPLGRVKFQIPNAFGVYMHDTSNRNLFKRDTRTLSHGCVRVGGALDFADDLLVEQQSWSPERRDKILGGWKTTTITLDAPVAVHLMYETASVDADGRAHFLDDVYGRDRRLADALAGRRAESDTAPVHVAEP